MTQTTNEVAEYNPPKWLIERGWKQTATVAGGECLYTLEGLPNGLWATAQFHNLTQKDAMTIQGCIERLLEKLSCQTKQ